MNNLINDTSKLTPIEIALGIDTEGRTTATKLYEFLELNPSNYSKWFRKNITDNEFAEENVDFTRFVLRYESATGAREREDAKLTASFAKKLSMLQKNQKGEAARNYFIGIENGAKKLVKHYIAATPTDHPGEVAKLLRVTSRHMEKQGSEPYEVAENAKLICEQYGIMLSPKFVKVPEYVQMKMADFLYRDTL